MDGVSMCRICLVQNIRRYAVADRHLLDFYEKLTDFPFVTDDNRPLLVCVFCYNKLKQCCQLLQMCLIAEELFNQMTSDGYQPKTPFIYPGKLKYFGGLTTTPIEHVSILDRWEEQGFADEDEAASEDVDSSREDSAPPETVDVKEERLHYKEQKIEVELLNVGKQDHIGKEEHCLGSTDTKIPTLGERRATTEDKDSGQRKMLNSKVIPTSRTRTSRPTVKNKENSKKSGVKKHLDKKPYTCDVCQRTFKIKYLLDSHILIHTGEKPYTCDICQNSFRLKRSLYSHIRVHTGEKPYKCKQCPKSFRQITHLKHHVLTHTSEKPYPCDVCQHRFTTKSNLQTHYRVHTNEKPHKCHICQRSFKTRWILKHHILTHTGEKPHKCQICQRSFSRKANLENHILIHSDKKQYQCEICAKFFSQASSLNGHLRVHIKLGKKVEETSLVK